MKRFGLALLAAIAGYLVAAVAGYVLIGHLSSNVHDRTLEAVVTGAFVVGPLGAVATFVFAFVRLRGGSGRDDRTAASGSSVP